MELKNKADISSPKMLTGFISRASLPIYPYFPPGRQVHGADKVQQGAFPEPEGPIRETISPLRTWREIPFKALTIPLSKCLTKFFTSTIG